MSGLPIDSVTLYDELKKEGNLDSSGGAVYISKISQYISSAANVEYHAKILYEKSALRKMLLAADNIKKRIAGLDDSFDIHSAH